jgi:hypothetical protein
MFRTKRSIGLIALLAVVIALLVPLSCQILHKSSPNSELALRRAPAAPALQTENWYARAEAGETFFENSSGVRYADKPQSVESEPLKSPQVDPATTERLVIYNAVMNVVVDRIADSQKLVEAAVVGMGGYMQEMTSKSITLKVPAHRFLDAVELVETLGEVTHKDIKGSDVTDQMRDLNIRLDNAEKTRQRLIMLLDKADKVEDMLKIEKELGRITETIEILKGKIAHLQNKIAFSTLTVRFNSPVPQIDITSKTPFSWVHELGSGMTEGIPDYPYEASFLFWSKMKLPEGYLKYYEDDDFLRAMSAEGVILELQKQKNYENGTGEYWAKLVRRVLVAEKVFNIKEERQLTLNNLKLTD